MPFVNIHPHRIFYELTGDGPPLVLLHHATASSRDWRKLVAPLAESSQVLTYDRPGFGRSSWLESWPFNYHTQDMADLIALLDRLNLDQVSLMGHSDGATVALLAAAIHPQRVASVVAEAPHVAVETPRCPDAVRAFVRQFDATPALQAAIARDHGDRAADVVNRWAARWLDPDFWRWNAAGELDRIQCPVLVVHGADDPFFSVKHSEMICRRISDAQLTVVPGAGHVPHQEMPQEFLAAVLPFLSQRQPECVR